jgi:hypothetical protein
MGFSLGFSQALMRAEKLMSPGEDSFACHAATFYNSVDRKTNEN